MERKPVTVEELPQLGRGWSAWVSAPQPSGFDLAAEKIDAPYRGFVVVVRRDDGAVMVKGCVYQKPVYETPCGCVKGSDVVALTRQIVDAVESEIRRRITLDDERSRDNDEEYFG